MTLELILWIVAGIILWEGIYIWRSYYYKYDAEDWLFVKFTSLLLAIFICFLQFLILTSYDERANPIAPIIYSRLIGEIIIIVGIVIIFKINKRLFKYITLKKSTAVDSMKGGVDKRK